MALQNFVSKVGPKISAAWLNAVDKLKETIFENATTKAAARANLTTDVPFEVGNGGTGVRSYADLAAALSTLLGGFTSELSNNPSSITHVLDLGAVASSLQAIGGTPSTTITSFGSAASTSSPIYLLRFTTDHILVHSSTLLLPGNTNIGTADGDYLIAQFMGGSSWRVSFYQRQNAAPDSSILGPGTTATLPFYLFNSGADVDGKHWAIVPSMDSIELHVYDDAYGFLGKVLGIRRVGSSVQEVELPGVTTIGGIYPDTRAWISKNTSFTVPTSYARSTGTYHPLAGGAGDVYTFVGTDFPDGTTLHFANFDSNPISIVCSGVVMKLAGTTSTGTRTLAQNGRAWAENIGGTWLIHGYGLT